MVIWSGSYGFLDDTMLFEPGFKSLVGGVPCKATVV